MTLSEYSARLRLADRC